MKKNIRAIGAGLVVVFWLALTMFAWFGPAKDISQAERRPLAQMPEISFKTVLDGAFMEDFGKYSLDQFPGRDAFRTLKSLTHRYVLGQKDNNEIYIAQGHAAQLEYPMDTASLDRAMGALQKVYDSYLAESNCRVYTAVIPDKGYFLAEANGYPAMDYEAVFDRFRALPWGQYVDIAQHLALEDYYRTDSHWRQEAIDHVAGALADAMGVRVLEGTAKAVERPFYGVYYGQAALPMAADTMYLVENDVLDNCRVYDYVTDSWKPVYDRDRLAGRDMYEVYLSGAQSLLRIENPDAKTDRELVIFRDSYGSSLAPLLVADYRTITLVDIRYIPVQQLGRYVEFENKDVLMIYSTTVLNRNLIG